jgi:hypothetical protein
MTRKILSLVAACLLPVGVCVADDARAQCGMGDVDFYPTEHRNVALASELLSRGETKDAAWILQQTWPRLPEATPVSTSIPVIEEGVRLMALALVRSDGDVKEGLGWRSATAADRAKNVAWGISRLRMILKAAPGDVTAKTDLGEALSRSVDTRQEASVILEALDRTNGITSPEGFAALALVRSMGGDTTGAMLAARACERVATDVANQCTAAGARVIPTVVSER